VPEVAVRGGFVLAHCRKEVQRLPGTVQNLEPNEPPRRQERQDKKERKRRTNQKPPNNCLMILLLSFSLTSFLGVLGALAVHF